MSAEPQFPGEGETPVERHLRVVPTAPEKAKKVRQRSKRRRALVPQASHSKGRGTIVFAFLLIPVALIFILLLNILVAGRQYDLVQLRAQEKTLTQQNEAASQEIEFYQAPQDLSTRASQLGLVAGTFSASLDLKTGEIEGTPVAASKTDATGTKNPSSVTISPPALYDTDAYSTASKRAEEAKASAKASASASPSQSATPSPTATH